MGRPLNKNNFGDTTTAGSQIQVTADVGSGIGVGFIIAQKSTSEFDVDIGGNTGRIRLVNSTSPGVGEGYIQTYPVGGVVTIISQTELNFDNTGSNGTWNGGDGVGGTAYSGTETITLNDGTVITVDVVDGDGDVTEFTVFSITSGTILDSGVTLTQTATSGTGVDFTLTVGNDNLSGAVLVSKITQNHVYTYTGTKAPWTFISPPTGLQVTLDEE